MTAAEVRQLSRGQRQALYDSLRADKLPVGTYDGRTWPVSVWPIWRGKVFSDGKHGHDGGVVLGTRWYAVPTGRVVNRVLFFRFVRGRAVWLKGEIRINYPLGLRDYLKPVSDTLWLGYLKLGPVRIWFTLEQVV